MPSVSRFQLSDLALSPSSYQPGGFSTRICRVAGTGQPGWLYKEYTPDKRRELNAASLEFLVRWRQDLDPANRDVVDSFCAYPRVIVYDGLDVAGILMDEARVAFLQLRPAREPKPRQADALGRRRDMAREPEVPYFTPPHKLALLGSLLDRLIWLHDRHLVIGDLQPSNILVTAGTDSREVYLIDCDSFWLGDLHVFPPHEPDMWHVGRREFSPATDLAKFARLVARTICENFSIDNFPDEELRKVLPGHHVRQLERMWSMDPSLITDRLRSMARSWRSFVRPMPGGPAIMYVWPDSTGRILWSPPDTPADPPSAVSSPTAPLPTVPIPAVSSPPAYGATGARPWISARPARVTWRRPRRPVFWIGAIAAVLAVLAVLGWALSAFAAPPGPQ
jgi:hypothetical protein